MVKNVYPQLDSTHCLKKSFRFAGQKSPYLRKHSNEYTYIINTINFVYDTVKFINNTAKFIHVTVKFAISTLTPPPPPLPNWQRNSVNFFHPIYFCDLDACKSISDVLLVFLWLYFYIRLSKPFIYLYMAMFVSHLGCLPTKWLVNILGKSST